MCIFNPKKYCKIDYVLTKLPLTQVPFAHLKNMINQPLNFVSASHLTNIHNHRGLINMQKLYIYNILSLFEPWLYTNMPQEVYRQRTFEREPAILKHIVTGTQPDTSKTIIGTITGNKLLVFPTTWVNPAIFQRFPTGT